jgi:hypothetical protein
MKKWIVLLLLPVLAFTVSDWKTVKVDDRVSVDFPTEPEQKEMSGNAVWVADVETGSRCMVMVLDFEKFGLDSAKLSEEMQKPEALEDFRNGVLGQIQGATLISEKASTVLGHKAFDFVIDMGKEDTAVLNKMYNKNIFIGSKMYSMSFYEKDSHPEDALRAKFFGSFKLN